MFCSEDKDRNSSPWWYLRRCRRTARTRQTTVDWGSEKVNARTSPIASSSDKSAPIPAIERSLHCPSRRLYPFSSNSSTATGKLVRYLGNRLWRRSGFVVTCFLPGAANSCPLWRLAIDVRQRAPNLNSMTSVVSPCAGSNFPLRAAVVATLRSTPGSRQGPARFNISSSTHRHCEFDRTLQVHALRQVGIHSWVPVDDFTVCAGLCTQICRPGEKSRGEHGRRN